MEKQLPHFLGWVGWFRLVGMVDLLVMKLKSLANALK
jgi:hypothetical protein